MNEVVVFFDFFFFDEVGGVEVFYFFCDVVGVLFGIDLSDWIDIVMFFYDVLLGFGSFDF